MLGICVGMQVMFESGVEHGVETPVSGEWPGVVASSRPVLPHMGWNTVDAAERSTLFAGVEDERFYFVHSYGVRAWCADPDGRLAPPIVTWTEHGTPIRRRRRERSAVGDPVPSGEVRRRGAPAAPQLARRPSSLHDMSKEKARRRAEERAKKHAPKVRSADRAAGCSGPTEEEGASGGRRVSNVGVDGCG